MRMRKIWNLLYFVTLILKAHLGRMLKNIYICSGGNDLAAAVCHCEMNVGETLTCVCSTFSELWKTESLCSSHTERFRQHAVEGKLRRSGEWPITPSDRDDVHDAFRRSI